MSEEILTNETVDATPIRKNNFCVIAKIADENGWRSLQTNSAWVENPYGEGFAVVPDDMVSAIMETMGFCDIVLNEDGTEVVEFTATEIPDFPEPEYEPTAVEQLRADIEYLAIMTGVEL